MLMIIICFCFICMIIGAVALCITATEILGYQHKKFKNEIIRFHVQCEKISFLKFRLMLSEIEKTEKMDDAYVGKRLFDIHHVVYLSETRVIFGRDKYAYFNPIDYLIYYCWLNHYTNKKIKEREFYSKFVTGLFDTEVNDDE